MSRMTVLFSIGVIVALLGGVGIAFLLGERHALESLTVIEATPDELAAAMQNDEFYSDDNERTLVIRGLVASAGPAGNGTALQFQTHGTFTARCEFDENMTFQVSETVRVIAEGARAQRLPSGVQLTGCRVLSGG